MTWFKRYAISCLIVMFVLGCIDGYTRPGKDMRMGAIVIMAVGWPVLAAIIIGSSIGEVASEIHQGKIG